MRIVVSICIAVAYALLLRLLFGVGGTDLEVMSGTFLFISPFVIGFLNIIVLPKGTVKGSAGFFLPWLTCLCILLVTLFFNIEGIICWIMIYPLFAIAAGIGGLVAYYMKHNKANKRDDWDFEKNSGKLNVSIILMLPIILGFVEGDKMSSSEECTVQTSMDIDATPAGVWQRLTSTKNNLQDKTPAFWSSAIGFPKHVSTKLDTLKIGGKRMSYYERGLYFEEKIAGMEQDKMLALDIKTDPTHIPPTVMDEHIIIGGKHVDILRDIYKIEALRNGQTRVTLTSVYTINTPFNWYADLWASFLMKDILRGELISLRLPVISKP